MKTIELPDNIADALVAIGKEMGTQDNLSTSFPIWVVMESEKRYVPYMWDWEHKERANHDGCDEEAFEKALCTDCRKLNEDGNVPDDCEFDLCDTDAFLYYTLEDRPSFHYGESMFFTQKECQEHIDSHRYHYTNPRTYAYSAYDNYEMRTVMQALILAAGLVVPSNHYGRIEG